MIYECEHCETALGPGLLSCPNCGENFDEPVPDDALLPEAAPVRRSNHFPRILATVVGVTMLIVFGWLGRRALAPVETPIAAILPSVQRTEMTMHPAYAADMTALVHKLHASGVGAEWPAFGASDTLIIIPPTQVKGQPAVWNTALYRQLAQGIYAGFWEKRYESGFSDSDSTTCFVLVCDESGKVTAADLMGTVE
jgi:hypothetical protein